MDVRKVIAFGKSSFVVSLPKEWMETNNIKKGDVVFLEQEGERVCIRAEQKETQKEEKTFIIEVDNKSLSRLQREIASAFINYNDVIILQGKDLPQIAPKIVSLIHELIALEIVEQSHQKIISRDFLKVKDVHINEYLRKADLTVRSMFQDLENPEFKDFKDVQDRQLGVKRIHLLIYKVFKGVSLDTSLIKHLSIKPDRFLEYMRFNYGIQYISLALQEIAKCMDEANPDDLPLLREQIAVASKNYLELMRAFYKEDKSKALIFSENRDEAIKSLKTITPKSVECVQIWSNLMFIHKEMHELCHQVYN